MTAYHSSRQFLIEIISAGFSDLYILRNAAICLRPPSVVTTINLLEFLIRTTPVKFIYYVIAGPKECAQRL